jgi:hypothetical protein
VIGLVVTAMFGCNVLRLKERLRELPDMFVWDKLTNQEGQNQMSHVVSVCVGPCDDALGHDLECQCI